jgi:hypothetical protein
VKSRVEKNDWRIVLIDGWQAQAIAPGFSDVEAA